MFFKVHVLPGSKSNICQWSNPDKSVTWQINYPWTTLICASRILVFQRLCLWIKSKMISVFFVEFLQITEGSLLTSLSLSEAQTRCEPTQQIGEFVVTDSLTACLWWVERVGSGSFVVTSNPVHPFCRYSGSGSSGAASMRKVGEDYMCHVTAF